MVKKGAFILFIKNLADTDGLTTELRIIKEVVEEIEKLEERIKVLESAKG